MNILRAITYIPRRTISNKNVGIRGKLEILKRSGLEETNLEELDAHDLDEFEADFMHADKFHKEYEQEKIKSKQLLKNRIVASKYFKKENEPNFLTSVEKDQIRKLHEKDPEVWTVEELSKSFPALPETINKILKSKWSYTSVDQVLKYDAKVDNNWKLLKAEKLPVSPVLYKHLEKFQNRSLVLSDRHILAKKLIPPKAELPKPRSRFFSNIVQKYLDQETSDSDDNNVLPSGKETKKDKKLLKDTNNDNTVGKNLLDKSNSIKENISFENNNTPLIKSKPNSTRPKMSLHEFVRRELPRIYERNTEEAITLLYRYKKYLKEVDDTSSDNKDTIVQLKHAQELKEELEEEEEEEEIEVKRENLNFSNVETSMEENKEDKLEVKKENLISLNVETSIEEIKQLNSLNLGTSNKEEEALISLNESEIPQLVPVDAIDTKLDTYVKERISKISECETYSHPIKIPRKLYEKGKTYRISDCYYDDDGEFLYRVPGVRN
ncbi:hypothetical protein M0802_009637 [Mischocyttarus mexicanus]|nr:hypothetical protein M0802_009637 [Mischocyttarus mexicanus]